MGFEHNLKEAQKFFRSLTKQAKFAGGLALNDTSAQSTIAIQQDLQSKYDITTSWARAGNKYGGRKSKPESGTNDVSQVIGMTRGGGIREFKTKDTKDHWIYDHEIGTIRKAREGENIAIPTELLLEKIGSTKGKRGRGKLKRLLDNPNNETFVKKVKKNDYLMVRRKTKKQDGVNKTRKRNSSGSISSSVRRVQERAFPALMLRKTVKIDDTLDIYKTISMVYDKNFTKNFYKRFEKALATMKVK